MESVTIVVLTKSALAGELRINHLRKQVRRPFRTEAFVRQVTSRWRVWLISEVALRPGWEARLYGRQGCLPPRRHARQIFLSGFSVSSVLFSVRR